MNEQNKDAISRRLRSIEGHVRGIRRMVDEDAYCMDVMQQVRAVQAALRNTAHLILEDHLNHCVVSAVRSGDASEQDRVMGEIMDVFHATTADR